MPVATCTNCGRITNSATSNYLLDTEINGKTHKEVGVATQCYVAFVDGKCVKGCVYKYISPMHKKMFTKLLENKDT